MLDHTINKKNHMTSHIISTLISRIDSFPPLPTVATRVMELTADPDSSTQELMKVVNADQSLAIMILKMANSPFFGLSRNIDSLTQALTLLGFKEVRNMVLARAVFDSFKNVEHGHEFEIQQFWRHSFLCGLGARIIGVELRWVDLDFFVAGLIHDIGKLVMHMTFPLEYSRTIEAAGKVKQMAFKAEKGIFGVTHDEVGMMLLKRWMFPESLIAAVGYHHSPREAKAEPRFPIVIHAADILAHLDGLPGNFQAEGLPEGEYFGPEMVNLFQENGFEWDDATPSEIPESVGGAKGKRIRCFRAVFTVRGGWMATLLSRRFKICLMEKFGFWLSTIVSSCGSSPESCFANRVLRSYWRKMAKKAMEMVELCTPDCILLDVLMPKVHGQAFLSWLRKKHRTLPVFVVSGIEGQPGLVAAMEALGIAGWIPKPSNPKKIAKMIREAVAPFKETTDADLETTTSDDAPTEEMTQEEQKAPKP